MTTTGTPETPDCPAVAHFTRVSEAVATLAELAAGPSSGQLAEMLTGDDLALARMRAAADVLRGAGMPIAAAGDDGLLRQAARWKHYARGPVTPVHAACGHDMARGLLRLWARRHGPRPRNGAQGRTRLRQARVALAGQIRVRCAALRAELRDDAGSLRRGQTAAFARRAAGRAGALARELRDGVDFDLGGPGVAVDTAGVDIAAIDVPMPRTAALENRLTWLIGAGFGTGTALSAARLLSEVLPAGGAVVGAAAAAGVTIGGAVVRTRRLLCERAAADRWVLELTAALRAALDEHLATRALAAEAPVSASWPVRGYTRDSSDILAITDGLHARVNLPKAGERPIARDG